MICLSCAAELHDDTDYCLECVVALHTDNIEKKIVPERTISTSKVDYQHWDDYMADRYTFECGATLEVTNKRVIVRWDRHTIHTPLNRIRRVETKKGDCGWRNIKFFGIPDGIPHELSIAGVGVFIFDKYKELYRVAQLINSLILP